MQTATSFPKVATVPSLRFSPLNDNEGVYQTFYNEGHTLVGRRCPDWQEIPELTSIILVLNDGSTVKGRLRRQFLLANATFYLEQIDEPAKTVYVEFVQEVYEAKAFVKGEAYFVN